MNVLRNRGMLHNSHFEISSLRTHKYCCSRESNFGYRILRFQRVNQQYYPYAATMHNSRLIFPNKSSKRNRMEKKRKEKKIAKRKKSLRVNRRRCMGLGYSPTPLRFNQSRGCFLCSMDRVVVQIRKWHFRCKSWFSTSQTRKRGANSTTKTPQDAKNEAQRAHPSRQGEGRELLFIFLPTFPHHYLFPVQLTLFGFCRSYCFMNR